MAAKTEEEAPTPIGRQIAEMVSEIPALRKEGKGQVGQRRYAYLTLDTIMHSIRPALASRGLSIGHDIQTSTDGALTMVTYLRGPANDNVATSHCPLIAPRDMQKLGAAITYARRYSVCMLLGLVADEDDDAASVSGDNAPATEESASLIDQVALLKRVDGLSKDEVQALKREIVEWCKDHSTTPRQFAELMVEMTEKGDVAFLTSDELNQVLAEIEARSKA